jgi:hypothetical protein
MSNSIFEQLHVGTVSNLASFGSKTKKLLDYIMYLLLDNNIKQLLDSLRMSSRWLTRLSCLLDSIMNLAKIQNLKASIG